MITAGRRPCTRMIPGTTRKRNQGWEGGAVTGWLRSGNRHQRGDGRAVKGAWRSQGTRTRGMVGTGRGWDPFVRIRPATNIPFM